MSEPTGHEDESLEEVLADFLYTDEGMFGVEKFDAERELYRRIAPPDWARQSPSGKKFELPTLAKEWHK